MQAQGIVLTHFIVSDDVERSRRFYTEVLGGETVLDGPPAIVALANGWIVINVGGGPTDDKPTVTLQAHESVNVVRMNPAELRDRCLSFPGAEETFPFGPETSVFKVAGKMFALSQLGADSLRVSVKCEPELAQALRGAHAAVLPGYHLNKRHWNTVIIDGSLPDHAIRDMLEDSYDLVVSSLPRARRRALGWRGDH
jgi:predicted DNA-binding protein (MmcQ/YjbR family)